MEGPLKAWPPVAVLHLKFRTTRRVTDTDRAKFIRIYEESFPREERDETDALLSSIASGERLCDLVYAGGVLVGLSVLFRLSARNVEFLEYFAVDSGYRNQGIGSRFLGRIAERLRSQQQSTPGVVFEVERPDHAVDGDRRLRQRRIDFYTRNGAVLVDCALEYEAPNLAGEGTLPYLLMWMPLGSGVKRLEGKLLRACVEAILTESYGLRREDRLVAEVVGKLSC